MTRTEGVLILLGFLALALTGLLVCLLLLRNRSSTPDSPTVSSTPPTPSVDPTLTLAMKMMETMTEENKQTRHLMETLLLGRETTNGTSPPSTPSFDEVLTSFDYDATPLSPGIEAVIDREVAEDQQEVSLKERRRLQERIRELTMEEMRLRDDEDSSPGPWSVPEVPSDSPT